jgi:hypothetical protein
MELAVRCSPNKELIMPKAAQRSAEATKTGKSNRREPESSPPGGAIRAGARETGERDEHYNLVSVLYHALQGAETLGQYVQDVSEADHELRSFLEETRAQYAATAQRAKQLLVARADEGDELSGQETLEEEGEDEEDEEDEEDDE